MKVNQTKVFSPVVITLETQEELEYMYYALLSVFKKSDYNINYANFCRELVDKLEALEEEI